MREIKFRAWLKQENAMVNVIELNTFDKFIRYYDTRHCKNSAEEFEFLRNEGPNEEAVFGHIELMQFTGLKDKNGVEIFEGDIYHQGDPNITYTVVWHDTGLIGKQNGSSSYAGLGYWQDRIEVIGNIYENPELLEVQA